MSGARRTLPKQYFFYVFKLLLTGIEALSTLLSHLESQASSLETQLQALDTAVASIESDISGFNEDIASIQAEFATVLSNLASINTQVEGFQTLLTALETQIQGFDSSIGNLETNVASLLSEVNAISSTITTLESELSSIAGDISTLQSNVSTLQSNVSTLQSNISTLQSNVSSLQSNVSTLQSNVSTLQSNVSSLSSTVSSLNSTVSSLNSTVSALDATVTGIQTNVGTLQSDVAALQSTFTTLSNLAIELERSYQILALTYGIDLSPNSVGPYVSGLLHSFSKSFDILEFQSPSTIILSNLYFNLSTTFPPGKIVKLTSADGDIFFAEVVSSSWAGYGEIDMATYIILNVAVPFAPVSIQHQITQELEFSEFLKRDGSVKMMFLSSSFETSPIGESNFLYLSGTYGDITANFPTGSKIILFGIAHPATKSYKELVIDSTSFDNFGGLLPISTRLNFTVNISPIVQVENVTKIENFIPSDDQDIATVKYVKDAIAAALGTIEAMFSTNFGVDANWDLISSAGSYGEKSYEKNAWSFHSTSSVRGGQSESFDSSFCFRDRGIFSLKNIDAVSDMTGFSLTIRDWMDGSGVNRIIKISFDGGDNWTNIQTINKSWFNQSQVYEKFTHYFSEAKSFLTEDFQIMIDGGNGTNTSRINIGQFEALDNVAP